MSRFAWFAPNAGVWISTLMEHRTANALVDAGHEVLMVQCDAVLDAYCPTMSALGVHVEDPPRARHRACSECRHDAGLLRDHARYGTTWLSSLLPAGAAERADEVVASAAPETWEGIVVDGLPVGLYAAYTSLLHHKVGSVTDSPAAWREYLADLRNAVLVAAAMPALVERIDPTHAVVYNALYPANRVFAEWMRTRGVPVLNLSGGPTVPRRYSTLAVYDGITASQTTVDSASFARSMEVPCSEVEVVTVSHHLAQLMSGSDPWVYSGAATGRSAADVRAAVGVRPESPVVTVIVSSLDEARSFTKVGAVYLRPAHAGFSEPGEFLAAAVELARTRPDVDFVFRLHPRLAPNKRDSITSPDLETIYRLLDDLPPNGVVNHPTAGISLYDLILVSDAALNHSSSAGLEFLTWGMPVVQYDPERSLLYPLAFSEWVPRHDADALRAALDRALASGFDLDRSVRAFRWYATLQVRTVVHLDPLPTLDAREQASPHATAAGPHPLGRLLPGGVKERIAQRLQRRVRAGEIDDRGLDAEATAALLGAVVATTGSQEVWEPHLTLPVGTDAMTERAAVAAALARLSTRLDLAARPGLGALRSAGLV